MDDETSTPKTPQSAVPQPSDDDLQRQVSPATRKRLKAVETSSDEGLLRQISEDSSYDAHATSFGTQAGRSVADSTAMWAEPSQTLIFLDWDDTLFPTTELFNRWSFPSRPEQWDGLRITEEQVRCLDYWRDALSAYLRNVCAVSKRVVIVTNARPGWVESTVNRFAPELQDLFGRADGPRVVYACEVLRRYGRRAAGSPRGNPALYAETQPTDDEIFIELSRAKFVAMQQEAKDFYSQYPDQTWKNIISVGDARYEHSAAQDLVFRRRGPDRENIHLKCIVTPEEPPIRDMIYRLNVAALLWPMYVAFDGDLDVDMNTPEQLRGIARALDMPELASFIRPFPISAEEQEDLVEELDELTVLIHDRISDWKTRRSK